MTEEFFRNPLASLETGHSVKLSSFGNFELRDKAGRPGRNPRTMQSIPIEPKRVVTFKVSNKLKNRVDQQQTLDEKNT